MRVFIRLLITGGIISALALLAISSCRQFSATGELDLRDSVFDVVGAARETGKLAYSSIEKSLDIEDSGLVDTVEVFEDHEPMMRESDPALSEVLSHENLWPEDVDLDRRSDSNSSTSLAGRHLTGEELDEIIATIIEADSLLGVCNGI